MPLSTRPHSSFNTTTTTTTTTTTAQRPQQTSRSTHPNSSPAHRSTSHNSFISTKPSRPSSSLNDTLRSASTNNNPYELVDQINRHNDLYHVLGLSGYSFRNRHQIKFEDIRKAYISRSRLCHPDKLPQYEPCTAAFQKLSAAYETLSKPTSRKLYDLSGTIDPSFTFNSSTAPSSSTHTSHKPHNQRKSSNFSSRAQQPSFHHQSSSHPPTSDNPSSTGNSKSQGFNADETLNGVLHATFCEFMDGDFEMIRVVINALNEGNPGLNLGEEVVTSLESTFSKLRTGLIRGQKYLGMVRFELMKLYEIQASLRSLSYFNLVGRLRLSLALVRVTLSIPMRIDQAIKDGSVSSDDEEEEDQDEDGEPVGERVKKNRKGILPVKVAGLLEATVAVLERGERVSLWPYSSSPSSPYSSSSSSCASSPSFSTSSPSTNTSPTSSTTTTTSHLPHSASNTLPSSSEPSQIPLIPPPHPNIPSLTPTHNPTVLFL